MVAIAPPSKLLLVGPTAFRAFRCVWALEELGVKYEHSTARPWSRKSKVHHPMGKIPSLVINDGEHTIIESAAINTYLGDAYGRMVPPYGTMERCKYDQTILFLMSEIDAQGLWIHRKHEALAKVFGAAPEAVNCARSQFDKANQVMINQIDSYLVGNEFTFADILYIQCLDWAASIGWDSEWKGSEKLQRYCSLCRSRPAYKRTIDIREKEAIEQQKRSKM